MKRANLKVNFEDGTINIFNENLPLTANSDCHAIPVTKAKQLISNLERDTDMCITLIMSDIKDDHNIALKLHSQFAYSSQEKLLQVIKIAGKPWRNNQNLKEEIKNTSNKYSTCKRYTKIPTRLVVGLP